MPTLADYMMQRDQTSDPSSRYSLQNQPAPQWATRLANAAAGKADYLANALLNPNSGMDVLRLIDQHPEIPNWLTMNMTPAGQAIQGSMDVYDAATDTSKPWQNRLAQGASGVLGMATAAPFVDTRLAGKAASGINKLAEYAQSGELTRPLANEYGVFVGPGAKGWEEIPGKFSSLADRMQRAEIDDSASKMIVPNNQTLISDKLASKRESIYKYEDMLRRLEEEAKYMSEVDGIDIDKLEELDRMHSFLTDKIKSEKSEMENITSIGSGDRNYKLSNVISHQKLFDQYPDLGNYGVNFSNELGSRYSGKDITLGMNADKQDLLHEIQHAIQNKEGWARGGSPGSMPSIETKKLHDISPELSWAYGEFNPTYRRLNGVVTPEQKIKGESLAREYGKDGIQSAVNNTLMAEQKIGQQRAYNRLAGEIEARDTASRANLTPEQRMTTPPYSSENIPLEDWIVRKERGGTAASVRDNLLENAPWRQGQIESGDDSLLSNAPWRLK